MTERFIKGLAVPTDASAGWIYKLWSGSSFSGDHSDVSDERIIFVVGYHECSDWFVSGLVFLRCDGALCRIHQTDRKGFDTSSVCGQVVRRVRDNR